MLKDETVGLARFGEGDSRTARVFARLRNDIMTGRLEPGRKLKIEDLRREYDSGSSTLREALSTMCADGLVERLDRRGFRVADVSVSAFDEFLKTRCWLEDRAVREAIANGDTAWEEGVVLAHHRLSKTPRTTGTDLIHADDTWERAHRLFHTSIISGCGSSILIQFCHQLYDQNIRYRNIAGTSAYPRRDIATEHAGIFDAVVARNADLAVEKLIDHYNSTGRFLRAALSSST
ncbi:MAG: GntR family transcriptional regulator [Alphaproteobacteria bacterium]